ncbi:MAG: PEP-CTERM sorting domain-containing protein [Gammaproteobacteria bacterium]|nr:PEP-CTERM sorting domain-containing protein [Gammaproteobacteria bacterium]MBU1776701.1 PEP-CTERM sorting domain-containing protein [Gammaproteobacteria bacterium]MBU1969711.1 PEP-CTERM sorting domain-containing protein [Gammaproteobacteria bacterium]
MRVIFRLTTRKGMNMKRILLGLFIFTSLGMANTGALAAGTLVIDNPSAISFSYYDGQPQTVTGTLSQGFWGSIFATGSGIFTATYLGNESGYVDKFSLGFGDGRLLESNVVGTSISMGIDAGTVDFSFSDTEGLGHKFRNGDAQFDAFGFAIMAGQTNQYGSFDYILGFNDLYAGDTDYDDFVVGINFAPVPEPQTYAMILAGLGLLGVSFRRRKSGMFD